jgi:hypothetical protein
MGSLRLSLAGGLAVGLLTAAGCGSNAVKPTVLPAAAQPTATGCAAGSGFAVSIAAGARGRPTPVAAASWFARHGGGLPHMPVHGWRVVTRTHGAATVTSSSVTVHVVQGPDRT